MASSRAGAAELPSRPARLSTRTPRLRVLVMFNFHTPGLSSINFFEARVYVAQDAEDVALVKRCRAGETEAFGALVERYQRVLFTVAMRMLGDYDEAADAAQNAFVKAFRRLETFDDRQRFYSWLYRILLNECLNTQRARRGRMPLAEDLVLDRSPNDGVESDQRRRAVQAAILALPSDLREVIVLRHFGDLSYDDIADALHTSVSVVKSRLHTARQKLGRALGDWRTR